jgi:hypothetical protein
LIANAKTAAAEKYDGVKAAYGAAVRGWRLFRKSAARCACAAAE